jgi:Glycosyltransferases involved in cell wall biogenesis
MKLSIITINLNNRDGLTKTIQSVLSQSYGNFEFIIIDGESGDGSVDCIREAKRQFPSLYWISEPDSGVFNAMNKGIRLAQGDYLLFLNSGDSLVDKDVLEHVFSSDYSTDILLGIAWVTKQGDLIWRAYPKNEYTLNDFYYGSLAHQAAFIKKDMFDRFGLYREDLRFMSDWEFFLRTYIINRCTLTPLDIVICDYDAEGISSDKRNSSAIAYERQVVYKDLGLDRIIPDYSERDKWLAAHEPLLWACNQPILNKMIVWLYRLAQKIVKVSR